MSCWPGWLLLLDRAALLAWEHAETAGAESPLHDLGLGIYLARGTAAQLLTAATAETSLGPRHRRAQRA